MSYFRGDGDLSGLGDVSSNMMAGADAFAGILAQGNRDIAFLLRPFWPAIDAAPGVPQVFKNQVKNTPIDALMGLFAPFEQIAYDIVDTANWMSGESVRSVEFPPGSGKKTQVMATRQPIDDKIPSAAQRDFIRRLRMVNQYMILVIQAPDHLANAVAKVLADRGMDVVRQGVSQVRAGVDQAAQMARDAASKIGINIPTINLPQLPALWGLGVVGVDDAAVGGGAAAGTAGTAAAATTATAATAATGVAATPPTTALIVSLIAAAIPVGGAVAVAGIKTFDPKSGMPVNAQGQVIDPSTGLPATQQALTAAMNAGGMSTTTMLLIGGGVLAVLGLGYLVWSKK